MIEHVRVRRRNRVPDRIEPCHPHGELGVEPADQIDDVGTGLFHECLMNVIPGTNGNGDQRIIGIEHDGTLADPTDTRCKGAFAAGASAGSSASWTAGLTWLVSRCAGVVLGVRRPGLVVPRGRRAAFAWRE